jgi:hypothetical protein
MVLQAGSWPLSALPAQAEPSSSSPDIHTLGNYIPPVMLQASLQSFEKFYSENHSGRKLSWLYNQSLGK